MRHVCYVADMAVVTDQGPPSLERVVFFGSVDEVYKDLETAEKTQSQTIIVHALDPVTVAVARAKLQIIRQLMRHDVNELPKYPIFGVGVTRMRDADHPVGFQITIRVSIRGNDISGESLNKPLSILLPAGVSNN